MDENEVLDADKFVVEKKDEVKSTGKNEDQNKELKNQQDIWHGD